jgi:hypothetical protein
MLDILPRLDFELYFVVQVLFALFAEKIRPFVLVWRFTTIFALLDLIVSIHIQRFTIPEHCIGLILLLFTCFLSTPLIANGSTCPHCGKRCYYKPLISNTCPHCKQKTY